MPYEIVKRAGQYVVKKKGAGGRVHGTHPSRARALAQMRALYAAEGDKTGDAA
jgi:hypothetical protein